MISYPTDSTLIAYSLVKDLPIHYSILFFQGLQCQERSLFLFSDMLLIAKERSSNNIKLKDQVITINIICKFILTRLLRILLSLFSVIMTFMMIVSEFIEQ